MGQRGVADSIILRVASFLRDAAGQTVVTGKANTDRASGCPANAMSRCVRYASLERGDYTLAVALIDQQPWRTLSLAIDAPAKDGWYLVSHVRVE